MRALLDTHVLLWAESEPDQLSEVARTAIADDSNVVFVSAVTHLEVAIKASLGKLSSLRGRTPSDFMSEIFTKSDLQLLPISGDHSLEVFQLPWHHRDPFDRLLIAQARIEDMTIITADETFASYDISVLW